MQSKNSIKISLLVGIVMSTGIFAGCQKSNVVSEDVVQNTAIPETVAVKAAKPALTGKMVFHRYVNYGDAAQMYIYNFGTNTLNFISQNWNLHNPINGHFNADGTKMVFMAEAVPNGEWDIYLWTVGSSSQPVNLTANNNLRDEDPKFSPNGFRICFKQTDANGIGQLKIMDLNGTITNHVTNSTVECSMPYYSDDATALIYARGVRTASDIYKINIDGTNNISLANVNNLLEYYPIVLGPNSYIYSRSYSVNNIHDQVYMGNFGNATKTRLPFNTTTADFSDAYPCGTNLLLLSSTKAGGSGGYDLYLANSSTGNIWSLNQYNANINGTSNELGVAFTK